MAGGMKELLAAARAKDQDEAPAAEPNGLTEAMQRPPAGAKKPAVKKPARTTHQTAAPTDKAWTPGEGRSSNPDYGRLTVYLPKQLRTQAERKWEDQGGKDMSSLFEQLLSQWVRD